MLLDFHPPNLSLSVAHHHWKDTGKANLGNIAQPSQVGQNSKPLEGLFMCVFLFSVLFNLSSVHRDIGYMCVAFLVFLSFSCVCFEYVCIVSLVYFSLLLFLWGSFFFFFDAVSFPSCIFASWRLACLPRSLSLL